MHLPGLILAIILGPAAAQPLPEPAEAIAAHTAVRGWLESWSVPADDPAASRLPSPWGVSLTVRLDGRVLARASANGPAALRTAAEQAIREARSKVQVPNDALAEENLAQVGERLTLSLEFYATPIPIPASELAMPMAGVSPGSEALVVAVGAGADERTTISGIDSQLSRGVDPARELTALAAELTGDGAAALRPVAELLDAGFRFARAPVLHLAMPFENAAPVFLDRGARRIGLDEIHTDAIRRAGQGIASHLRGRLWPGVERYGLAGDLRVVTGAPSPMVAPPFEQGLVAYALLRHAAAHGSAGPDDAREAALTILRDLAAVEPDEQSPWDRSTAAGVIAAALSMVDPATRDADTELLSLRVRTLNTLRAAFDPAAQSFAPDVPPAARGLIAWALTKAIPLDPSFTAERAESAVRTAFRETPQGQLVAQMPFLAWAELALHPDGSIPAAAALDEMRAMVWDHQIHRSDLRAMDQDLAGGVVFTRARTVLPTWQTMRPLAALATMMGDERLTPGTPIAGRVPGELVRMTEGLRFVRQLAWTGDALFLARRADQAIWGVRPALWEPTASLEAGAMALLTITETLDAMNAVAARSPALQGTD